MDIFESLENLPVSEECFDEIMGIVEDLINETIYDAIDKKYGKGENKTLRKKAIANANKEMSAAWQRDAASSGSSNKDEQVKRALQINRAQKRFGDGKSIHMEQERQMEKGNAKPITNEIGKAIVKGNDELVKAHKDAHSASRLFRKAYEKEQKVANDPDATQNDYDNAFFAKRNLADKAQAAMDKLSDINKKQKENAKYAKYVKYAGSVPNKTGSGTHFGIKQD
jgi:hypothetical protein